MHIYAFGSICRGEISPDSDIDLLAITDGDNSQFDLETFSVYSYTRIREIWKEGNPFAWHLFFESKLLFSSNHQDYLKALGHPSPYQNYLKDCYKFYTLFQEAHASIENNTSSRVFDLSTIFLSIRNIATCFSLGVRECPNFARNSALHLDEDSISLSINSYRIFERARILCTRGQGENIGSEELNIAISKLDEVDSWMNKLLERANNHERIQ